MDRATHSKSVRNFPMSTNSHGVGALSVSQEFPSILRLVNALSIGVYNSDHCRIWMYSRSPAMSATQVVHQIFQP